MSSADAADVRRRELAQIHIAKAQLGMDDDAYREILWAVCRVKSSAELDWAGRKRLLEHLKACGFKSRPPKSAGQDRLGDSSQAKLIRSLWLELHAAGTVRDPSEKALAAWVKRMTGVDAVRWLKPAQLNQVIEALKKWNDRPRR
jgi:phage gp16-like protein